jgi:hypothetical protein
MNYASVVFMGFATISVAWYFIRGRKTFTGPPVVADADPTIVGQVESLDGSEEAGAGGKGELK